MMIKHIFQKEPVLSIATCLAIISAFFVPRRENTSDISISVLLQSCFR